MDYQLTGKTALVTGASKGIGFAIAQSLAAEGVRVVLSARGQTDLYKAAENIRASGGDATGLVADVSDPRGIDTLFEEVKKIAAPDILIVNAGGPPAGLPSTLSQEAWAKGYDLTLMSAGAPRLRSLARHARAGLGAHHQRDEPVRQGTDQHV